MSCCPTILERFGHILSLFPPVSRGKVTHPPNKGQQLWSQLSVAPLSDPYPFAFSASPFLLPLFLLSKACTHFPYLEDVELSMNPLLSPGRKVLSLFTSISLSTCLRPVFSVLAAWSFFHFLQFWRLSPVTSTLSYASSQPTELITTFCLSFCTSVFNIVPFSLITDINFERALQFVTTAASWFLMYPAKHFKINLAKISFIIWFFYSKIFKDCPYLWEPFSLWSRSTSSCPTMCPEESLENDCNFLLFLLLTYS